MIQAIIAVAIIIIVALYFPRRAPLVAGLVVAVVVLLLLWVQWQDKTETERQRAVTLKIEYLQGQCESARPLYTTVTNGSALVLQKVSWRMQVRRRGHSSDLVSKDYQPYVVDKILQPGEQWSTCLHMPPIMAGDIAVANLDFTAAQQSAEFSP